MNDENAENIPPTSYKNLILEKVQMQQEVEGLRVPFGVLLDKKNVDPSPLGIYSYTATKRGLDGEDMMMDVDKNFKKGKN